MKQVGNLYLIDEDNDGVYDYKYNFETNTLSLYSNIDTEAEKSTSIFNAIKSLISNVIVIIAIIVVLIILIFSFIVIKKSKNLKINIETKKENSKEKSVYEQVKEEKGKPMEVFDKNIEDEVDKILANKK